MKLIKLAWFNENATTLDVKWPAAKIVIASFNEKEQVHNRNLQQKNGKKEIYKFADRYLGDVGNNFISTMSGRVINILSIV